MRSSVAIRRRRSSSGPQPPIRATWRSWPPTEPTSRRNAGSSRLLNQDMFSAYSMTEPQGGSDPRLFKTLAVRDGDEWVINGEKWFTSAGRVADLLFVMCTNGIFIVPRTTPGVEIMPEPRNHNHIIYRDVRVPADHLLGPEDGAHILAQRRLGGGRIHHAMRTIAQCKMAFDMMCERALSRQSHGAIIAEHQMVQEKIAESYAKLRMLRLFVLETAWKMDQTFCQDCRTDIATVKFTMSRVLREISFDALQIHGSLGTTDLTPLQDMYAAAPTMGLADGADEVHKATVARRVLRDYEPHEGHFPREFLPTRRKKRGIRCNRSSTSIPSWPRPPSAGRSTAKIDVDERCRMRASVRLVERAEVGAVRSSKQNAEPNGREALIEAARALFAERGIEGVSIRELGRAAEQRNNNAVQYHFGDRGALLLAVLGP